MLDLDWFMLAPEEDWIRPPNSKSRSRAESAETTHEDGRHFFRVYGVFTRRLIFSPVALRLPESGTKPSPGKRNRCVTEPSAGSKGSDDVKKRGLMI